MTSSSSAHDPFVNVPVPASRVQEVYALLGKSAATAAEPLGDGWTDSLIRRMYAESADQMRELLKLLAKADGEEVSTNEIAAALELPKGAKSVAGMVGALGRRVNSRYGMEALPWTSRWRYIDLADETKGTETLLSLPKWACNVINEL